MSKTQKKKARSNSLCTTRKSDPKKAKRPDAGQKPARTGSKQAVLITLLQRPAGATIEEMVKATGWQQHSVRGLMSGVLKKRLQLTIDSEQEERGRVYRIAGGRS